MDTDVSKREDENRNIDASRGAPRPGRRGRRLGIGLALTLGIAAASVGVAQGVARAELFGEGGGRGGGEGFMLRRIDRLLDAAQASEDQRTKIRAIWEGARPQMKAAREQHGGIRRQLAQALAAPTIDRARIEELRKQQVQGMDRLSSVATQAMIASAEVLTPEQRQKVIAEMAKHRFHGGKHRGRGPGAPGGPGTPNANPAQ